MKLHKEFYISAVILIFAIFMSRMTIDSLEVPLLRGLDEFPMEIVGWKGVDLGLPDSLIPRLGVDNFLNRNYVKNGKVINFYVGYYKIQKEGDVIHTPRNCLPARGWTILNLSRIKLKGIGGSESAIPVNRVYIKQDLSTQVVFYWYISGGRVFASEFWGKIYLVLDAILRNRTDGTLVRVMTESNNYDEALTFAREAGRLLRQKYIPS